MIIIVNNYCENNYYFIHVTIKSVQNQIARLLHYIIEYLYAPIQTNFIWDLYVCLHFLANLRRVYSLHYYTH